MQWAHGCAGTAICGHFLFSNSTSTPTFVQIRQANHTPKTTKKPMKSTTMKSHGLKPEEYFIEDEPYYQPVGEEIAIFEAAYKQGLPILLKGPTGCGKTRFMEHMAWRLKRPLITVSCHDDLTASDLVGRFLISGGETVWVDGPLARSVRNGAICYLDEIVEARKDTTVVIHPDWPDRRPCA